MAAKDPFLVSLGTYLRSVRKAKGWTQETLAFKCGLHPTYVAAVERGVYNVTIGTLRRITGTLGVSLTETMKGTEGGAAKKPAKKPK